MRAPRALLAALVAVAIAIGTAGSVWADVENATGTNVQEGDNRGTTSQAGTGKSGDAVGGQVAGVVSSGRTSVDATNASRDSSVSSGDVNGSNIANSFTGLDSARAPSGGSDSTAIQQDVTGVFGVNVQEGDNRYSLAQTANANSGDGVAGEVIGVVTAGGGSTSVVAANTSQDVDVTTGDADAANDEIAFVGQNVDSLRRTSSGQPVTGDVTQSIGTNVQDGNNRLTSRQASDASTGDGVAGQVIGSVSAGATSIDANNRSESVSVDTGDATAANASEAFVGQNLSGCTTESFGGGLALCGRGLASRGDTADVSGARGTNVQDGNNRASASQSANANSGDGVAGEVIGAVTSAGGSTSIVAANTSRDSDITTGDAKATNDAIAFAGQNLEGCRAEAAGSSVAVCEGFFDPLIIIGDVTSSRGTNIQDGNNSLTGRQAANASTGDGVAGQVIGAVSAGATSIDARNTTDGVSVETGDATAANDSDTFVGQNVTGCRATAVGLSIAACESLVLLPIITDVTSSTGTNVQDGSNRGSLSQAANATSGDGVAGEVIGAVTSAGGSASIVAANTSRDSDVTTGDAEATNSSVAFVGQNVEGCTATAIGVITVAACESLIDIGQGADVTGSLATNVQDGNNRLNGSQSANASSGDGVAGQVIGAVSAGATSVDARNTSDGVSVETGAATSANDSDAFVGQRATGCNATAIGLLTLSACETEFGSIAVDVVSSNGVNVQDGNNSKSFSQSANASSGDAVAGQVSGIVTSAGGSASVVVDNTSTGIDATSGESEFNNDDIEFVGQNVSGSVVEPPSQSPG